MAQTTRWGLRYPIGTDAADVPGWMELLAEDLDDVAKDDQGTLASRPVSTVGTPGKRGRYYKATDTEQLFRDHGTGWEEVPLGVVPAAYVLASSGQQINHNTNHPIAFTSQRFDTDSIWTLAPNPTRLTCQTAGIYTIGAFVGWLNQTTGKRSVSLWKNGSSALTYGLSQVPAPSDSLINLYQDVGGMVDLAVGDYMEVVVVQNQGINFDLLAANAWMARLGPGP